MKAISQLTEKNLTFENGETLPHPYSLQNDWIEDVDVLPEVSWEDVMHYLKETPSIYTKGKLKAYKSLEACDYNVCGHVQKCYYHPIKKTYHFALLNHGFFQVRGRVIQAICTVFGYAFIKNIGGFEQQLFMYGWIRISLYPCGSSFFQN